MRIMNEHYAHRFEFGNTPARATIEVSSLPTAPKSSSTGIAVRDLGKTPDRASPEHAASPTASPCVFAGDTLYCSLRVVSSLEANGGVYSSTTALQLRQTMRQPSG